MARRLGRFIFCTHFVKSTKPCYELDTLFSAINTVQKIMTTLIQYFPWLKRFNRCKDTPAHKNILLGQNISRYRKLMETAQRIAQIDPLALTDLIRAIIRPLQSDYLLGVAEMGTDPFPNIDAWCFFGKAVREHLFTDDGMRFLANKLNNKNYRLNLAYDPILPWAWKDDRYISAIATIGKRKKTGASWEQDSNHCVELWLPWGIGFVCGGNHSITAGILAAEGTLIPDSVYDMGFLFNDISCDGAYYLDRHTGKKLEKINDYRRAAIFEIGRIMQNHGYISPLSEANRHTSALVTD